MEHTAIVNTGRQIEVDLAKLVCMVGMIFVHCLEVINNFQSPTDTVQYVLITVLNSIFGAGTFMFCMGLGIVYSTRSTPQYLMKRGFAIFLLGYLLNLVRSLLLVFVYSMREYLGCVFAPDVLQFAGLALLLFGLFKQCKAPDWLIAVLAAVMSVAGSLIGEQNFDSDALDLFLGLFIQTLDRETLNGGCFPLLNWFIFVVAGYLFAKLLQHIKDKTRFYLTVGGIAAVVLAVYMILAIPHRFGMMGSITYLYRVGLHEAAVILCGAVFALSVHHFIAKLLSPRVQDAVTTWSRRINAVYCIQWVVISWSWAIFIAVTGKDTLPAVGKLLYCLGVAVVTFSTAAIYTRIKRRKKQK